MSSLQELDSEAVELFEIWEKLDDSQRTELLDAARDLADGECG